MPSHCATGKLLHKELSDQIIGAAIEVHRELGPGLLESAYQACLAHELSLWGIPFVSQLDLPLTYKKLSQNRWHGRLARANVSPCERSAMMKRTGETPVPPQVGF